MKPIATSYNAHLLQCEMPPTVLQRTDSSVENSRQP